MRFKLNCRQASTLLLQSQDRTLRTGERLGLRLHLMICEACTRFNGQLRVMRGATDHWKQYRDTMEDDAGGPPGA